MTSNGPELGTLWAQDAGAGSIPPRDRPWDCLPASHSLQRIRDSRMTEYLTSTEKRRRGDSGASRHAVSKLPIARQPWPGAPLMPASLRVVKLGVREPVSVRVPSSHQHLPGRQQGCDLAGTRVDHATGW